jgi:hypothetical protein
MQEIALKLDLAKMTVVSRWIVVAPIVRMMDLVCRFLGSVVLACSLVLAVGDFRLFSDDDNHTWEPVFVSS